MESKLCSGLHIYKDYKRFFGLEDCDLNLECPRCWADKATHAIRESINQGVDTEQPDKD